MTIYVTVACFTCLWIGYKIGHVDGRMNGEFEARMKDAARKRDN